MITIRDINDRGQDSFEVSTARATYLYQKAGCGFSGLIDRDGRDWIGYRVKGGPKGDYRGIPNMAKDVFGHPGYSTGRTELLSEGREEVTLRSTTDDAGWDVEWRITETHAEMTANRIAAPVWLLYEGSLGGRFHPGKQFGYWSDGTKALCSERWREAVPTPKWVAFCDPQRKRSIALAYEGPDEFPDTYWPMGGKGGMTVFGFGRTDKDGFGFHVKTVPFRFSFALVESVSFEEIAAYVKAYLPVSG